MVIDIRDINSRFFKEEIPSNRLGFLVLFRTALGGNDGRGQIFFPRVNVNFFRRLYLIKSHRDMRIHAVINGSAVRVSKVISRSKIARINALISLESSPKIQLIVEAL